ncbi:MAG: hypothetical protein EHJ94_00830 [Deltaproteobacteria bacterium]|nr:MAG: hypothetical protein EHJ94_00830 [Deltaproteobacteria bacterium]
MNRMQTAGKRGILYCSFLLVFFLEGTAYHADAHKVTIFAWVEGNTVYTESKFAGGRKAKNAPIVVYDQNGTKLLEGKTDENGMFSFEAPKKVEMKVTLLAGMGHQGEWVIPATDFTDKEEPAPAKTDESASSGILMKEIRHDVAEEVSKDVSISPCLNPEDIQRLIDNSLDKKLKPISIALHRLNNPDHAPSMSEILGGIGYIFGLVGVAAYVHARKEKRKVL